ARRLCALAGAGGMLVIIAHPDLDAAILGQRLDIAGDRAVAVAADRLGLAVDGHFGVDQARFRMAGLGQRGVTLEGDRAGVLEIFLAESVPDQRRLDLLAGL